MSNSDYYRRLWSQGVQGDDDEEACRKRIPELQAALNELTSRYNFLVGIAGIIPIVRLTKLIKLIAEIISALSDVPKEVWEALFAYLQCNNDKLAQLTKEQLIKLVKALKALAELEVAAAEDSENDNPKVNVDELNTWIQQLENICEQVENMSTEQLVTAIANAKAFINEQAPRVLQWYLHLFGDDVRDSILRAAATPAAIFAIKQILKTIIYRILVLRLGQEVAKRIAPLIGIVITLLELLAFLAIIAELENIKEIIDRTLVEFINLLLEKGYLDWPTFHLFAWFKDPDCLGATVVIKPYVHCFKKVDGKLVRDENPCPLKFIGGATSITKTLSKPSDLYNANKKRWEIPFEIDDELLDAAPCVQGAALCYTYLEIKKTIGGKTTTIHLLIGAKSFDE